MYHALDIYQFKLIWNIFNNNFKKLEKYTVFVFVFFIMRVARGNGLKNHCYIARTNFQSFTYFLVIHINFYPNYSYSKHYILNHCT